MKATPKQTLKQFLEEQAILKSILEIGGASLFEEQEWSEGQTADELLAELRLGNNNI